MQADSQDLIAFIQQSPTPFHAVHAMLSRLTAAGFMHVHESEHWQFELGQKYVITRNDSSIIAFNYQCADIANAGVRMIGAHTDSPNLKVKPNPDLYQQGFWQVGVETYGGVLLNPWFDRPLALAGRVTLQHPSGEIIHRLVDSKHALGIIPSLAIHLDREANKNRSINPQTDLPVLMSLSANKQQNFHALLQQLLIEQHSDESLQTAEILDFEISFYEAEPGGVFGVANDFIAASRLDNLLSCYMAMQAMIHADSEQNTLMVCNDHEEVGSQSASGADGAMLAQFLKRFVESQSDQAESDFGRMIDQSMMVSSDNAHGIHPNFAAKHDANHGPLLGAGPVIKINANQRYASNSVTQAIFRRCCAIAEVPVQAFVVRTDMACGSTIGPMTAAKLGVKTVDVGVPTFAMHSIRETAACQDVGFMLNALMAFYCLPSS